ncbi:hypothetical protein ACFXDH_48095 [Streptomyces sp. NPDC059467]|uniref:hypothetical protein n=1 Tax=Streptomyces sp. NPDC059467 TaxID=3346844 RepID=UPI003681180E
MSSSPVSCPWGRLVYAQRDLTVIGPARHVCEYGRLVVRRPAAAAAVPYRVDDTLLSPHPKTVAGLRPAPAEA